MRANEQGEEEIYEHHKRCIVTIEEERKNERIKMTRERESRDGYPRWRNSTSLAYETKTTNRKFRACTERKRLK